MARAAIPLDVPSPLPLCDGTTALLGLPVGWVPPPLALKPCEVGKSS